MDSDRTEVPVQGLFHVERVNVCDLTELDTVVLRSADTGQVYIIPTKLGSGMLERLFTAIQQGLPVSVEFMLR